MGGWINAESTPGKGSIFTFTINVRSTQAPAHEVNSDGEKIPMNQMLVLGLLSKLGYDADKTDNGRECLERLLTNHYDLILMDLHMPELDGLTTTREIRRRELGNSSLSRTFICALTANALVKCREECSAAGMDEILTKPFRIEELLAIVNKVKQLKEGP